MVLLPHSCALVALLCCFLVPVCRILLVPGACYQPHYELSQGLSDGGWSSSGVPAPSDLQAIIVAAVEAAFRAREGAPPAKVP